MSELDLLRLRKLAHLRRLHARAGQIHTGISAYHDDPVAFARECIDWRGRELGGYQADVMARLADSRRMSLRAMRGAGKTTAAAIVVLWFALTRDARQEDWKIITTAGSWGQLVHYLWPEIHKWAGRLKWDKVRDGRPFTRYELQKITLRLEYGEALAAASANSNLIEGGHAEQLLIVCDEAKSIPAATFDSIEGAMSTGQAYALMMSVPGDPSGRFHEVQTNAGGRFADWQVRAVTLAEALEANSHDSSFAAWVESRRRQWGEQSALFRNHVLGEFHASDESNVIPLRWVELGCERHAAWEAAGRPAMPGRRVVAVDVARFGTDSTCIMIRQGSMIHEIHRYARQDTMTTADQAAMFAAYPGALAVVDTVGIGAGVADRLRRRDVPTSAFVASAAARYSDGRKMTDRSGDFAFANMRCAAWWLLRETLDPSYFGSCTCPGGNPADRNCWKCSGSIGFPDDPHLLGDLSAPKWKILGNATIAISTKDQIRTMIGRSTDTADALIMAHWWSGAVHNPERAPAPVFADIDSAPVTSFEDPQAWQVDGFPG